MESFTIRSALAFFGPQTRSFTPAEAAAVTFDLRLVRRLAVRFARFRKQWATVHTDGSTRDSSSPARCPRSASTAGGARAARVN